MSRPLEQVLTRAKVLGDEPSAWAQGEQTQASPSARLRVLDSHKPELRAPWLDRVANQLKAFVFRWLRPLPRLMGTSRDILKLVQSELAGLSDDDLNSEVLKASSACKVNREFLTSTHTSATDLRAMAVVTEVVRRVLGYYPHQEQLAGALALLEGRMVEMATGEGKTLAASIAAVVAAWRGLPCHVVTANDYLAARDASIGQPLFMRCGVSASSVVGDTELQSRGSAYQYDIVYTTAKELLADHLRDELALGQGGDRTRFALAAARQGGEASMKGVVMRGIFQVVVDEADGVLIDEAVTPLIISAPHPDELLEKAVSEAVELARALTEGDDFQAQLGLRQIQLTDRGRAFLRRLAMNMPPFWRRTDRAEELVQMALYAMHLMKQDQHYVLEDGKVVLVDELTGRLARQRTLSLGMQQVLEASLGLAISPPSEVSARLSFQRFFRRFTRLGGLTGTAREARNEFAAAYGLTMVGVPTHRPVLRIHHPLRVLTTEREKFEAIADECAHMVDQGRAVLIGSRSVQSSTALAHCVQAAHPSWNVQVLHALHHDKESAIVAAAGRAGAVTIATNMAGRGTDIMLDPEVRSRGGLHVVVAEVNDFARIDRQLVGRCARQGDPGSVRYFVALDDEVFRRFLPRPLKAIWAQTHKWVPSLRVPLAWSMIWTVQFTAERFAFRRRQRILEQDIEMEREGF